MKAEMVNLQALRFDAPVAQLDRVADFESEGWGFDSLRARSCNCSSQKTSRFSRKCHPFSPQKHDLGVSGPVRLLVGFSPNTLAYTP